MRLKRIAAVVFLGLCAAGQNRLVRQNVRGVHIGVAAGSEYATEAGMRLSYQGGNAVDVGVAAMYAA